MPGAPDGPPDPRRRVCDHGGGPLLLTGPAGSGKTSALVARFATLVARGEDPERILALPGTREAAESFRRRLEDALGDRAYAELPVMTLPELGARLLRDEAHEAGLDPFAVAIAPADRLALLLERIDDLTLRHHDFRGDPAALLGAFVRRIDRLKEEGVSAADCAAWAATLPDEDDVSRVRAAREREFAGVWQAHDAMLAEAGALDSGDEVLEAVRLLRERPHARRRIAGRFRHILVDDLQDLSFARKLLLGLLASEHANLAAAADPDASVRRLRGAGEKNLADFRSDFPGAEEVAFPRSRRSPARVARAAAALVAPLPGPHPGAGESPDGAPEGEVRFWRCANERAQAQAVAADVARLVAREGVRPARVAILVRSVAREGRAISVALEERDVPHRILGSGAFFRRAEVRDLLAWLRLLHDPGDAGAVVRALARPPIELSSVDLARVTQIARRRKLDMVAALVAATEAPQIPPEARDRIHAFLKLYRAAAGAFDTTRPDLYVQRLIERLGLRRQLLFAAQADVVERLRSFSRLSELAAAYALREPRATAREFAAYVAAVAEAGLPEDDPAEQAGDEVQVLSMAAAQGLEWDHVYVLGLHAARMPGAREAGADPIPDALLKEYLPPHGGATHAAAMRRLLHVAASRAGQRLVFAFPQASERGAAQPPSPFCEEARAALGAEWEDRAEELFGPAETLHAAYRALRDELLEGVSRTGSRLGELRFDTDLDISHAVVRYLELVKLAALIERAGQSPAGPAETLPEINARLLGSMTAEQREIYTSSSLDELLLGAGAEAAARAAAASARREPSLEPFLPRRGEGLVLSASDIESYRTCPLKYKFARVFRIPSEPTIHQRFGIVVHQVLERFHGADPDSPDAGTLPEMMSLLDAAWWRFGFGDSEEERQLRGKATAALTRYHERFAEEPAEPVFFERSFSFKLGPHVLRGRVDRVDRLPGGGHELIDYKTGRPKSVEQLADDVQLSLYAVAAHDAWQLEAALGSYYYVLDDAKVAVPRDPGDREWITDTVMEVAGGIGQQGFEPTPSYSACSRCDFRIACPAAEV